MTVRVLSNAGGGYVEERSVNDGTLVGALVKTELGDDYRSSDFLIRVNHEPVTEGQALRDGDLVSITPTKMDGA